MNRKGSNWLLLIAPADDVTDKKWPEIVSVTSYEGATYTHQGWVLDKNNQEFLVLDDEIDEIDGRNPGTPGKPFRALV